MVNLRNRSRRAQKRLKRTPVPVQSNFGKVEFLLGNLIQALDSVSPAISDPSVQAHLRESIRDLRKIRLSLVESHYARDVYQRMEVDLELLHDRVIRTPGILGLTDPWFRVVVECKRFLDFATAQVILPEGYQVPVPPVPPRRGKPRRGQ
jgi:hypothetical protein